MNQNITRFPKGTWMKLVAPSTLRGMMDRRGLSISTTARYAGCSKSFIGHLLTGRKTTCTPALAVRIAGALGLPVDVLFLPSTSVTNRHTVNTQQTNRREDTK